MDSTSKRDQAYMTSNILLWIFVLITLALAIAGLIIAVLASKNTVSVATTDGITAFRVGQHLFIVNGDNITKQNLAQPHLKPVSMVDKETVVHTQPQVVANAQVPIQQVQPRTKAKNRSIEPSVVMVQLDDLP